MSLALAVGCGEESGGAAMAERPPAGWSAKVRIAVDPDGRGPARERTALLRCPSERRRSACRRLRELPPTVFAPVDAGAVCTEIYGGPQTARIRGRVGGRLVDGRFKRTNGCQIARYDRVRPLLRLAR